MDIDEHVEQPSAPRQVEQAKANHSRELGSPLDLQDSASPSLDATKRIARLGQETHFEEQQDVEEEALVSLIRDRHGRSLPESYTSLHSPSVQSDYTDKIAVEASNSSDLDPYIKAETEEYDDNESIHHNSKSDAAGPTINVTSSIDPALPETQTHATTKITGVPALIEAPQEVQTLLSQWWDVKGRKLPPCVTLTAYKVLWHSQGATNRKATWLHISGEVLEPSMYRFNGFELLHGLERRIIVVQEPTVGPFIVGYLCSGGHIKGLISQGTKYRIWHGVDSESLEGFEQTPSVWKGYPGARTIEKLSPQDLRDGLFGNASTTVKSMQFAKPAKPNQPLRAVALASDSTVINVLNEAIDDSGYRRAYDARSPHSGPSAWVSLYSTRYCAIQISLRCRVPSSDRHIRCMPSTRKLSCRTPAVIAAPERRP